MKSLTIAYVTSRIEPCYHWFFQSLLRQLRGREVNYIVVDFYCQKPDKQHRTLHTAPKPTVWQGRHRKTKEDWWAASNARNTAICLCETEWIAFLDDRCVLMPTWLDAIEDAMRGGYAVCGPYEKRHNMTVENGVIRNGGIITGKDNRLDYVEKHYSNPLHHLLNPYPAPGEWWYGCSTALPLDWALHINGYDETCDSSSGEDYIFGLMLQNNGYPIRFDTRMMMIEDRTPEAVGKPMIRKDKGVSPNDKSHALLAKLKQHRTAQHPWNLRIIRDSVLRGGKWPEPDWPVTDWYDGTPISEMV